MAEKILICVEILAGDEDVLRAKYASRMTTGDVVYLDGVRHGKFELDAGDLLSINSKANIRKWFDSFFNKIKPMRMQDTGDILKSTGTKVG